MKTIPVKNVARDCSQLVLGTDMLTPSKQEHADMLLDNFVEVGGNTLDTALVYVGGDSERSIGLWLQKRNNRSSINVLTKGAHPDQNGSRMRANLLYEDIMSSLGRLQTDYVEMYALHRDDPTVEVAVIVNMLNAHIDAGRIQSIGVSNWTTERITEANAYAKANGLVGFTFNSPNLSLAKAKEPFWAGCISADQAYTDWHQQTQMPMFPWSSQARGYFSGRYSPDQPEYSELYRVFDNDENRERLKRTQQLASETGYSPTQIALAYVLNQQYPVAALVAPRTREEMLSSLEATKIVLSSEQLGWLDLSAQQ